ncbi:MAG: hypothetical protein Q9186_005391 [Xanthomendoza sp. 1 TL-2023]
MTTGFVRPQEMTPLDEGLLEFCLKYVDELSNKYKTILDGVLKREKLKTLFGRLQDSGRGLKDAVKLSQHDADELYALMNEFWAREYAMIAEIIRSCREELAHFRKEYDIFMTRSSDKATSDKDLIELLDSHEKEGKKLEELVRKMLPEETPVLITIASCWDYGKRIDRRRAIITLESDFFS